MVQTQISRLIKEFHLFAYWMFYQKASFLLDVGKQCRHISVVWSRGFTYLLIECSIKKRPFCWTWANSADTYQSSDQGVSPICLLNVLSTSVLFMGRRQIAQTQISRLIKESQLFAYWMFYQKASFLWGVGKQHRHRSVVWSRGLNCLLIECSIKKRPFCGTWANSADTYQSSDQGVSPICLLNVLSTSVLFVGRR